MKPRTAPAKMGDKKGKPHLFISGKYLFDYGWTPGTRFTLDFKAGQVVLKKRKDGERRVSHKRAGTVAVIDINSPELASAFGKKRNVMVTMNSKRITVR